MIPFLFAAVALASCKKDIDNVGSNNSTSSQKKFYISVFYVDGSQAEILDTTKWHYVAVLFYPDRRCEIYIDGIKEVDYYRRNLNYQYTDVYLAVSNYLNFHGFYKGYLDELRISNVVRSQMEIQDYYTNYLTTNKAAQVADASTIGLWHFNESSGNTFANSIQGAQSGALYGGYSFSSAGINGNSIYFNGVDAYGDCKLKIPSSSLTIEFWFKSSTPDGTILQPYGLYSTNISFIAQ